MSDGEQVLARDPSPFTLQIGLRMSSQVIGRCGYAYVALLHGWLAGAMQTVHAEGACAQWVSSYQLFVDWVMSTGHVGIRFHCGAWISEGKVMISRRDATTN